MVRTHIRTDQDDDYQFNPTGPISPQLTFLHSVYSTTAFEFEMNDNSKQWIRDTLDSSLKHAKKIEHSKKIVIEYEITEDVLIELVSEQCSRCAATGHIIYLNYIACKYLSYTSVLGSIYILHIS